MRINTENNISGSKLSFIKSFALIAILLSSSLTSAHTLKISSLELEPFYGSKLSGGGMLAEIVTTAFKQSGRKVEIEYVPWKRAIYSVRKGNTDILMGPYQKTKNDKHLYFSYPFYSTYVGLVALKGLGLNEYKSLRDLKKYSIGVNNVFGMGEAFSTADYLFKMPFSQVSSNIAKLYKGHVDLVAMPIDVFKSVSKKMKQSSNRDTVFVYPPLTMLTLHIAISKKTAGYKKVIRDFNKGMKIIKSDGTYSRILAKHGF